MASFLCKYQMWEDIESRMKEIVATKFWTKISVIIDSALYSLHSVNREGTNDYYTYNVKITNTKHDFIRNLVVVSYYLPTNAKFLIQEELREICVSKQYYELEQALDSYYHMKRMILDRVDEFNSKQFYGWLNQTLLWGEKCFARGVKVSKHRFYKKSEDRFLYPEKRVIGVGYNDKGNLSESWKPGSDPYRDDALHTLLLLRREQREHYRHLIRGCYEAELE